MVAHADSGDGGSGFSPVSCILETFPLDVHGIGSHGCLWNSLFNNAVAFGLLLAIPTGLGLTFAFDGTSETITTTEAGTWAFSLGADIATQDATWAGVVVLDPNLYMSSQVASADFGSLRDASVCNVLSVPAGYSFRPKIDTRVIATNDPLNVDVYLSIVRLA